MPRHQLGTVAPVTAPENGDWNHRSELSLTDDQKAVSQVVEENRHGELDVPHFDDSDPSEKHVDNDAKEMTEEEEKQKKADKYAAKYAKYRD